MDPRNYGVCGQSSPRNNSLNGQSFQGLTGCTGCGFQQGACGFGGCTGCGGQQSACAGFQQGCSGFQGCRLWSSARCMVRFCMFRSRLWTRSASKPQVR